jgi:hypothetical protein
MGNQCAGCCSSSDKYDFEVGENLGLSKDGVTKKFQYHQQHAREMKLKFSKYD